MLAIKICLTVSDEENLLYAHQFPLDLTDWLAEGTMTLAQECITIERINRVADDQNGGAQPSRLTQYCLAMVGGAGMTLLILGASIGVIYGANFDGESTHSLGMMLVVGFFLLILAIGFWLGWVRPFERFDNINVPAETEHH